MIQSIKSYLKRMKYPSTDDKDLSMKFNKYLDILEILKDIVIISKYQLKNLSY